MVYRLGICRFPLKEENSRHLPMMLNVIVREADDDRYLPTNGESLRRELKPGSEASPISQL